MFLCFIVQVVNSEEKLPYSATVPDIPGQEPSHDVSINNTFYIDRSDFRTAADKGMSPGWNKFPVRLQHGYGSFLLITDL